MSDTSPTTTPLQRAKRGINAVLAVIASVLLIAMTLLVLYQVFTRYVLNDPADFTEELVRYMLIWTGFFGAAYAFGTRQHIALLFVQDRFPESARRGLMIFVDVLILVFAAAVVVVGGTQLALSAREELSALLGISRGLVYGVAPVAGLFIVLVQAINVWEDVTGSEIETHEGATA